MRRHRFWTIAAFAFLLRLAYVVVARADPLDMIDSAEYDALARGILAGRGIVDFQSFARPPLYPLFVALCYAFGGIPMLIGAQLALSAATAPLVGSLARALSGRPAAAPVGALLVAVYPWFFQWVGGLASETLFTFCLVSALVLIFRASEQPRTGSILLAGIVFGIASLARANALVLAPPIALWWWWRARDLRPALVLAAGIVLALVPYSLYNVASGKGMVLASNGGGISFYAGNNPDAARWYAGDVSDAEWRTLSTHSLLGAEASVLVGCHADEDAMGCVTATVPPDQREAVWYRAAFRYITSRPGEWARLEARKSLHYWRPWVEPRAYSFPIVLVSGLSFGGMLLLALVGLRRMPRHAALFVLAVVVGSTLSSVVWSVQLRYRFAMLDPVLIAVAAEPVLAMLRRLRIPGTATFDA